MRYHQPPVLRADAGENEQPDPERLLVNGDSLEISRRRHGGETDRWLLRALAPGAIDVLRLSDAALPAWRMRGWQRDTRVQAAWVEDARGVQIEIRLPQPAVDEPLALAYVDVDSVNESRSRSYGNASLAALRRGDGGMVRRESAGAQGVLSDWVPAGTRARLFDREGYRLADVNRLYERPQAGSEPASRIDEYEDSDAESASLFAELADALLARLFEYLVARHEFSAPPPYALQRQLHLDLASIGGMLPAQRYLSHDNDCDSGAAGADRRGPQGLAAV